MPDKPNILEYFGNANTAFLHAGGRSSTKFLLKELDCQADEHILELGFGTGATFVELASRNKKSEFYGIEKNRLMYEKAKQRIRLCGLSQKIQCVFNTDDSHLPFPDNSFDKVFCESVLAILEGNKLPEMLQEVSRILKPGGVLLFNETIWMTSSNRVIIYQVNEFCKLRYGIIQSNSEYPYLENWKNLLLLSGFEVLDVFKVDEIDKSLKTKKNWQTLLSDTFSAWGKLKQLSKPEELININTHLHIPGKIMSGIIIKSRLRKIDSKMTASINNEK